MSKSLDALKSLGEHHCSLMQKCESEECNIPCYECKYLKKEKFIEKELKAFNLLKDKKVDIPLFIRCSNLEDYNGICTINGSSQLTQEEYNILTEVML